MMKKLIRGKSHLVFSDVKQIGGPYAYTDVLFHSREEIGELIVALEELKRSRSSNAHIHLQDLVLAKRGKRALRGVGEVVFSSPEMKKNRDRMGERRMVIRNAKNER